MCYVDRQKESCGKPLINLAVGENMPYHLFQTNKGAPRNMKTIAYLIIAAFLAIGLLADDGGPENPDCGPDGSWCAPN